MNSKALWYLTRGSGVVALILLSAAVILGLVTRNRWSSRSWPRFVTESLHRNISLLSMVFMAIHIASSVLDKYVKIRWLDAVIPFGAAYKPLWLGIGALSFDLFLAVAITSLIRVRLGYRAWRGIHWLAYGCWALAIVHNLGVGSDRHQAWLLTINLVSITGVVAALGWRIFSALSRPGPAIAARSVQSARSSARERYAGALR
jgi:predicted ferric reductase